jgi:hypothetical protein
LVATRIVSPRKSRFLQVEPVRVRVETRLQRDIADGNMRRLWREMHRFPCKRRSPLREMQTCEHDLAAAAFS